MTAALHPPPPADPGNHPDELYGLLPEPEQRRPLHRRLVSNLRDSLVAGVLVFLPLIVTYLIFRFVFEIIGSLLDPIVNVLGLSDRPPWLVNFVEVGVIIVIIYIAGRLIGWAFTKLIIDMGHNLIARVPVIGPVYNTTRIGIDFLSDSRQHTYRGVVLIEFPRPGVMSIGLITSSVGLLNDVDEYLSIYVPTTPVPSSGYLVVVPVDQVIPTEMSVDEAMRIIISGGILAGDIFANHSVRINPAPAPADDDDHWLWGMPPETADAAPPPDALPHPNPSPKPDNPPSQ